MDRIKELINKLNEASRVYYQGEDEIMSNLEYDKLYDELVALEESTGIVLSNSPTQKVGYEVQSALKKITHPTPMLSLSKTKSMEELIVWLGNDEAILSWKLDGLTVVLTYDDGKLVQAVTRGNGIVGEDITENAKNFQNIPLSIPFKGKLVLRGEALIKYPDFEKFNASVNGIYKNPRNLCSGSVRQLDPNITKDRHVNFYAFALVSAEGMMFNNKHSNEFDWLEKQGFSVVEHTLVTKSNIGIEIDKYSTKVENYDIPCDGLVLLLDDVQRGKNMGSTAHSPRNAIAFKWADELAETTLREIEWSPSRTGLINPVAIFDPVELEGTTVSRASVHNLSIVKQLELGIGDLITVYKANMIIPQIRENLVRSNNFTIPDKCPICGGETKIKNDSGVETVWCTNPDCTAKKVQTFSQAASRDALNIDGLSDATIEEFISLDIITKFSDMFNLKKHRDTIVNLHGFGERSYTKLVEAAEKARNTTCEKFIYSLGLPGIGGVNAKNLAKLINNDATKLFDLTVKDISAVDGFGDILAKGVVSRLNEEKFREEAFELLAELNIKAEEVKVSSNKLDGKTFVITGTLEHFSNRKELESIITSNGGKIGSAVNKTTDYLINNDILSTSSKNKKAKELNIPIITENEFISLI